MRMRAPRPGKSAGIPSGADEARLSSHVHNRRPCGWEFVVPDPNVLRHGHPDRAPAANYAPASSKRQRGGTLRRRTASPRKLNPHYTNRARSRRGITTFRCCGAALRVQHADGSAGARRRALRRLLGRRAVAAGPLP